MAVRGQRFELDLDADDYTFNPTSEEPQHVSGLDVIGEIRERDTDNVPAAPKIRSNKSGFPEHRPRKQPSAFKQLRQAQKDGENKSAGIEPSDQAILHQVAKKHGVSLSAAKEKSEISRENAKRINEMSLEDIEEARAELMSGLNPTLLQKFLNRANIDEHKHGQEDWDKIEPAKAAESTPEQTHAPVHERVDVEQSVQGSVQSKQNPSAVSSTAQASSPPQDAATSTKTGVHFPNPPRDRSNFVPLDPNSPEFLSQLRTHYFPDLPHDPNALSWTQDPSDMETADASYPYNPDAPSVSAGQVRFSFTGTLIPPALALEIPVSKGLHHHGDAAASAGYTIPELAILERSVVPSQRCIAYQVLGRILFRLGRGDFGPRGSELCEGLWGVIERERIVEVMMAEANRDGPGHVSAKSYATEALWLWRRGGGGDRGVLKEGERRAT